MSRSAFAKFASAEPGSWPRVDALSEVHRQRRKWVDPAVGDLDRRPCSGRHRAVAYDIGRRCPSFNRVTPAGRMAAVSRDDQVSREIK